MPEVPVEADRCCVVGGGFQNEHVLDEQLWYVHTLYKL